VQALQERAETCTELGDKAVPMARHRTKGNRLPVGSEGRVASHPGLLSSRTVRAVRFALAATIGEQSGEKRLHHVGCQSQWTKAAQDGGVDGQGDERQADHVALSTCQALPLGNLELRLRTTAPDEALAQASAQRDPCRHVDGRVSEALPAGERGVPRKVQKPEVAVVAERQDHTCMKRIGNAWVTDQLEDTPHPKA